MTLTSAVNPNTANFYSQPENSTSPENAEEWEFYDDGEEWEEENEDADEPRPYNPSQGRRAAVIAMGMLAALVVLAIIGMTFVQGTWWYSYSGDQALDRESRTRLETVRDEVEAYGTLPQVVRGLNTALNPDTDPTAVRNHLLTAQEALDATGDPTLIEAARELRMIIQTLRPVSPEATITPSPLPTLVGLDDG
ncbi:MAG: hypothetical protein GY832_22910 [Chloroflexi bacterium]|nr:hypothetical protein [Chloroflexota bacterium]